MKILMIALFDTKSCGPTEVLKKIIPELKKQSCIVAVYSPYKYDSSKKKLVLCDGRCTSSFDL
jgi:hypothetical protein